MASGSDVTCLLIELNPPTGVFVSFLWLLRRQTGYLSKPVTALLCLIISYHWPNRNNKCLECILIDLFLQSFWCQIIVVQPIQTRGPQGAWGDWFIGGSESILISILIRHSPLCPGGRLCLGGHYCVSLAFQFSSQSSSLSRDSIVSPAWFSTPIHSSLYWYMIWNYLYCRGVSPF